ncbi:CGNR zinc finger domain-containing protein [Streptomyces sp. NPDC058653]|uniref:CGNR zinc finger domain-containing protein n=1 Tax=Streptomyces sp. NPDC058653 TaxID=3346576 RepID=UPI00365E9715
MSKLIAGAPLTGVPGRFRVQLAPDGLRLVQELLNTAAVPRTGKPDLLADPVTADVWLRDMGALDDTRPPADTAGEPAGELRALVELREYLRETLIARADGTSLPTREREHELTLTARLFTDGSVSIEASPRGAAAIRALLPIELYAARLTGTWQRLKVCSNPECRVAFYDRSRNTSGVWHDVRTCGNSANLKASRARRRAGADRQP